MSSADRPAEAAAMIGPVASGRMRGPAVLLLGAGLVLAGCGGDDGGERIRGYDVSVDAAADGSLTVRETIHYDFADEARHGIERSIPDRVPFEQTRDRVYPVADITVDSPTGAPTATEVSGDGGDVTIRIGDEDTEITGRHTYELTYRVAGVVDAGPDGDVLTWNAVGTGWEVPIDEVSVRLTGPSGTAPQTADCAVGTEDEGTDCEWRMQEDELVASAAGLAPGEGVTVSAGYPAGTFPDAEPVYEETFSPARAFSLTPATLGLALLGLLVPLLPAVALSRRGRDRTGPPAPDGIAAPELTPPHDARPAQLGTVLDGYAQRHELTATLLDLAVRGHLRIEEVADRDAELGEGDPPADWRLVRTDSGQTGLRSYEQQLFDAVFAGGPVVVLSDLRDSFAGTESEIRAEMYRDVVALGWFVEDPAAVRRRWYTYGALVLVAGIALTVGLALLSTWALVGVGVVLGGVGTLAVAGRMPQRSAVGQQVRERTAAFRDRLASAETAWLTEQVRVPDLAETARTDVAVRYLPYAVALGVAEAWAGALDRSGAGVPDWYEPLPGRGVGVWPAMLAFSSSANPALTPPASSTGGSTSVGSGAGGGGGGSW